MLRRTSKKTNKYNQNPQIFNCTVQMPRKTQKRRQKHRRTRRHRGGGDEDDFFKWVQSQKTPPPINNQRLVRDALAKGVQRWGLQQDAADDLLRAFIKRDYSRTDEIEAALIKFGGVDSNLAGKIVGK